MYRPLLDRRQFLQGSAAATFAATLHVANSCQAAAPMSNPRFSVKSIDRTVLRVPFRDVPARNMDREIPHWRYSEITEVELASGHRGFGETLMYYTWGATSDSDVKRSLGRHVTEIMWDDSLGAGLQMALFDALGKALDVPVHALLGKQVHERTPLSWWNIDTSAEDMASECLTAYRQGYTAYKTKGRPWYDLDAQVKAVAAVVPESFLLDMDFNDTLLDAERAIPILQKLEKEPRIGIFESPIFQTDIPGNQAIQAETRVPLAMHYDTPEASIQIKSGACDGFVVSGGAYKLMKRGAVCEMAEMPFWLQIVGTDVSAAWSLHFGGVLSQAVWPAVNCHQLFDAPLLTERIEVKDGYAAVPDRPGLGFELNRDRIAELTVDRPPARPEPERLIQTIWPDGRLMYTANNGEVNFMLTAGQEGKYPFFEPGADTSLVPDDGTPAWRANYTRARENGPFMVERS